MTEKDKCVLVFFIYHETVRRRIVIDISTYLKYLIDKGYEPSKALYFIMKGESDNEQFSESLLLTESNKEYVDKAAWIKQMLAL